MKTLVKWFVKRHVNKDAIKGCIRNANAKLAEKARLPDGKEKIIGYGEDAARLTGVYLTALADDGRIDPVTELPTINAECDSLVDKYLTDEWLEGLVDRMF